MAEIDNHLSDSDIVAQAQLFLADLQDGMKGIAALLTPEEEEAVNKVFSQQRSKPAIVEKRDAVEWAATTKAPDDTVWDWPSADQALRKWSGVDQDNAPASAWTKYEQAFAWYDQTNPQVLGSYKLPHHTIIDGKLCVVLKGVQAAMGALNGARGGTTIPAKDQDATYQHLVKHYHQFGATPPDQRSIDVSAVERRISTFSNQGNTLVGRAAVFGQWTTIGTTRGSFQEQIKPGAFDNIANCNVRALYNHDPNQILGSTDAGNVKLSQSGQGLDFQIELLDTTLSKDIRTLVNNGVVTGCSFGFLHDTCQDEWKGSSHRTLTSIPDVLDISICTFPAYPQTNVNVRSQNLNWKYALAMKKLRLGN